MYTLNIPGVKILAEKKTWKMEDAMWSIAFVPPTSAVFSNTGAPPLFFGFSRGWQVDTSWFQVGVLWSKRTIFQLLSLPDFSGLQGPPSAQPWHHQVRYVLEVHRRHPGWLEPMFWVYGEWIRMAYEWWFLEYLRYLSTKTRFLSWLENWLGL
jgi:hypothetical protein